MAVVKSLNSIRRMEDMKECRDGSDNKSHSKSDWSRIYIKEEASLAVDESIDRVRFDIY